MALEEDVTQLRKKALAQRRKPVPDAYQDVSKERIAEVLREIDRYTPDCADTVFALLDDEHDSWFSSAPKGAKFSEGASTAHIACHVGILQRGGRKIEGSVGTVYHYDTGGNLLAETDVAGALRRAYVWADGQPLAQIESVTARPPDSIVDNPQATFTGRWATATRLAGYYGTNYRSNTKGTGKDKAVWTVNVTATGTYQVYARWVAASTHASNAPYTVKHSSGSTTVAVNQRVSGGQWVLLGSHAFSAGTPGSVTLTDQANGRVIADAIKLVAVTGGIAQETVRYLHTDHLNTPRLATDANKQVVWRWEGTAFGSTPPTGSATVNLRFPGQYYDAETGLHYNWHRYYDPKAGRYITSDPIGLAGGLNTYAYTFNNPLRWTDPSGLAAFGPRVGPFGLDCGTGWGATFIPDGPFMDACRKHDKCYATCGKTKEQCDLEMCTNGACLYGFLLDGALSGPSKEAYDKAQKENGCYGCKQ